ncbi:MAG: amino acid--tRNA ligase-related protein [Dehalogenimonas sp.]|jgi:lysyl-tRNA synthetase class 2|uniref:Amino acid--tRNA ligase-related protein n=1 Tax=Candidatus Dehalogenimonas loeffleri TaxID=3127115 RepID=A0ABZ2J3E7_9CHLR|nr:amino acid--tRNA ligase-related protein [Dehalogenimonas sp.]
MDLSDLGDKHSNLKLRSAVVRLVRQFFHERHFLEVDTPQLAHNPLPEAFIEPIKTECGFLLPSPELYMKPLLAAGFGDIFQIGHCYRKNECGMHHLEEFTLLEYYRTGLNYLALAQETQCLFTFLAETLGYSDSLNYEGYAIDLTPPWPELSISEAFMSTCGWDPVKTPDPERFDLELATSVAELSRRRPLIIFDFPADMASLARLRTDNPSVAERAEIFIGGLELANIFSELTDPAEQRRRFEKEMSAHQATGYKAEMPEDFLDALQYLPESAGGALGIDRLVMLFCDAPDIRKVNAFPI